MFIWQANHEGAPLPVGEFPWEAKNLPYEPIFGEFYAYHTRKASDWALNRAIDYFKGKPLEAAKGVYIKAEHFLTDDPDGVYWNQIDDNGPGGMVVIHPIVLWGRDLTGIAVKIEAASYKLLLAAAVVGMGIAIARHSGRFMILPVVAWISFHALTMAMARYRFPLYSVYSIYAGVAIAWVFDVALKVFALLKKESPGLGFQG